MKNKDEHFWVGYTPKLLPRTESKFREDMLNEWVETLKMEPIEPPWWKKYTKVFVLAHTYIQARRWAESEGMYGTSHFLYLSSRKQLMGIRDCVVVILDGFPFGKAEGELESILRYMEIQKALGRLEIKYE